MPLIMLNSSAFFSAAEQLPIPIAQTMECLLSQAGFLCLSSSGCDTNKMLCPQTVQMFLAIVWQHTVTTWHSQRQRKRLSSVS